MSDPQSPPPALDATAAVPGPDWPPRMTPRRRLLTAAALLLGVVGVLAILFAFGLPPFARTAVSTEDAFVRGQVTVISPQLSGYVAEVAVQDYQQVRTAQLLARIDDRTYRQRVEQAQAALDAQTATLANSRQTRLSAEATVGQSEARIASAEAAVVRARQDERRARTLLAGGWVARAQVDTAVAARRQAEAELAEARSGREIAGEQVQTAVVGRGALAANVEQAQAALKLAQIDLSNTRIVAPRAGQLGEVGVRLGQYVTAGTQLTSLVPDRMWVVANLKETQLKDVRVGQVARFRVDALGGAALTGRVGVISPAAGSEFSVLRPDNATGNFVKVAQRIPVRIEIDGGQALAARLRPGMSVVAEIETR